MEDVTNNDPLVAAGTLNLHPPSTDLLAFAIRRFQLDRHISEIKLLFYHLPSQINCFIWPTDLENIQNRIKSDMDRWLADSSSEVPRMDTDESLIHHCENLKMELHYHAAITLLYQPSQAFRSPTQNALSLCYHSASRRLRIYNYLNNEEHLYYSWRNIHGIFSSGATIIYCLWASRDLQTTVPFADVLRDLRACSNLLSVGGQWWPSVRKGKESFEKVMDLTVKGISRLENRSKSPNPLTGRTNHTVPSSLAPVLDTVTHNEGPMDQSAQFSAAQSTNTFDPVCMSSSASPWHGYNILMNNQYTALTRLKTASIILSCSVMGPLTALNFQPSILQWRTS